MPRINLEFEGKGRDGDILVVDGQLPNFRTEAMPAYIQTLPKAPKLAPGQRAVLLMEGKGKTQDMYWKVREPKGITGGQSAGISIGTVIAAIIIYDRAKAWWENRDGADPD